MLAEYALKRGDKDAAIGIAKRAAGIDNMQGAEGSYGADEESSGRPLTIEVDTSHSRYYYARHDEKRIGGRIVGGTITLADGAFESGKTLIAAMFHEAGHHVDLIEGNYAGQSAENSRPGNIWAKDRRQSRDENRDPRAPRMVLEVKRNRLELLVLKELGVDEGDDTEQANRNKERVQGNVDRSLDYLREHDAAYYQNATNRSYEIRVEDRIGDY